MRRALSLLETPHPNIMSPPTLTPKRRNVFTLATKRKALTAYDAVDHDGTPPDERAAKRKAIMAEAGPGVDYTRMGRWRRCLEKMGPPAKRQKISLKRERMPGAGAKPVLGFELEDKLDKWVESRRRNEKHYRVSELMIKNYVKREFDKEVGEHCIPGFMKRKGWTMRVRTTTKQVTGEAAVLVKEKFQQQFAGMFATKHHHLIYNCDETSVFLDAPGNRTVERKGADIVEIGTTKHELDRIMVMLFISRSGVLGPPFVIHPTRSKAAMKAMELISVTGLASKGRSRCGWRMGARGG